MVNNLIQMQRMSELQLKKDNYDEFNEELLTIVEEERLNAEAP